MTKPIKTRRRIFIFFRLFLGIIFDFWREGRLAKKIGVSKAQKRASDWHKKRAIQFRSYALEMGGVLIKLGQFLSSRADIMPEVYLQELSKLQDTVPPVEFYKVKAQVEAEFNQPLENVFQQFKEAPQASASLAQVHIARLSSGETVAVKVLRPGIEKQIDIDLGIISYIMEGIGRLTNFGNKYDIESLVEEFAKTLGDELDFIREGFNAERFRENFKDSEIIYMPKVHWEYSRDKVLTLERVEGIKINNYQELESRNISRQQVAQELIQCYLKQILTDGFFHADPHPGNLFVVEGPRITFVDFGMVGEISLEMRQYFKDCVIAVARKDVKMLVTALQKLGFIRRGVNLQPIYSAVSWIYQNYENLSIKELTFESLENIQEDIRKIVYEQPFNLPSKFGFLGRAVGTLIGLTTGLYPDINYVEASQPVIDKLREAQKKEWKNYLYGEAKSISKILIQMPYRINNIIEKIENGKLVVKVNSTTAIDKSKKRRTGIEILSVSLFCSVLIVSSIFLIDKGSQFYGITFLVIALIVFLVSTLRIRK